MKSPLIIEAKNLTQAKRKASLHFNKQRNVIDEFIYMGIKFQRINAVYPSNQIYFGTWV